MPDDLGKILGAIGAIVAVIFIGTFAIIVFSTLGDQQCRSYQDVINQKDIEISTLNGVINQTNDQLYQCRQDYDTLIKQNITKKDFEEIKGDYNLTQIQINNLNQKFEQFNKNYNSYYGILIKNYKVSLAFNIAIGVSLISIEILSLALLKSEFIWFVISAIRKKKKESEDKEVTND